jgi:DNA repair protein RadD
MKFTPRWYQQEAHDTVIDFMSKNPGKHPLIAMPTGSGKSLVICMLIDYVRKNWGAKTLVLCHTAEILLQDKKAIERFSGEEAGLYSASCKSKTIRDITIAGIQSVYKKPELFKQFDLVIIDECHLISKKDDSMYNTFFKEVGKIYCGLTATPFRLGDGYIYGQDGCLFDNLVYDLTSMDNFNRLIQEGHLCKLKTLQTTLEFDTEMLHTRSGDFIEKEMSSIYDTEEITNAAIKEVIKVGSNYNKWLIFAIDINHAEHIAEKLIQSGIPTGLIHSKMEFCREKTLNLHRDGTYTALVNVNVLTTGYDDEEIDLIVILRPTESPVFHIQTVGRGLRISDRKDHCLILDFAGNTKRLGPVNDVHIKNKANKVEGGGEAVTKTCPECDVILHPSVKICDSCGYIFKFVTKLTTHSEGDEIIAERQRWYNVSNIFCHLQHKPNMPDSIKVSYECGMKIFTELWCLDYKGYARQRAIAIMKRRYDITTEDVHSSADAMGIVHLLIMPIKILVDTTKKYPQILKYKFEDN